MKQFALTICLLMVAGVAAAHGDVAEEADEHVHRVLVIGAIDQNLDSRFSELRPIADYIGGALADLGITRVEILVAEDRRRLARLMRDGRVDWVSANVANTVYLQEAAGVEILVRKWKQGAPQIRSVFFSRADSGIDSLDDLAGRLLAMYQPESTTGHFLPVAELMRHDMRTTILDTPRHKVPPGSVGLAFAGSHLNTTTWVHKRIVSAGVVSNVDWESVDTMPEAFRNDFVIFHQTDALPRALELVRPTLDEDLREGLKHALLSMDDDPAAAAALQAYQGTLRFDELETEDWDVLSKLRSTFAQLMFVQ